MNTIGKKMMKISGILCIVAGGIISLLLIPAFIMSLVFSNVLAESANSAYVTPTVFLALSFLATTTFAMVLFVGIIGVKNAGRADKAQFCFNLAIAMIVLMAINSIAQLTTFEFNIFDIVILALPIFFLISTYKNKKAN